PGRKIRLFCLAQRTAAIVVLSLNEVKQLRFRRWTHNVADRSDNPCAPPRRRQTRSPVETESNTTAVLWRRLPGRPRGAQDSYQPRGQPRRTRMRSLVSGHRLQEEAESASRRR